MGNLDVQSFIALDFATTGLDARTDQIIEAAIIRVQEGKVATVFHTLIQPSEALRQKGLDPKITEMTGHTMEDLEGGMLEADFADLLTLFLWPSNRAAPLLVAYNALFDIHFLHVLMLRNGHDGYGEISNDILDPLTIARDRHIYPHKLGDMCRIYGIDLPKPASTQDDALAVVDLVLAMMDEDVRKNATDPKWKAVWWYENTIGYLRKYGEPKWAPAHVTFYPQGQLPPVEHTQAAPPKTRNIPTYTPVIMDNKAKRKKRPDYATMSTEEFSKEFMPTGFIYGDTLRTIEDYFRDPLASGWCEVSVQGVTTEEGLAELDRVMHYLTEVYRVRQEDMTSYLDNPDEAVIEFRKPTDMYSTTPYGDISEDDLPF